MNSSVSALTTSSEDGASSSSASGGSGESGMSVNSGRCFSFTTRSDFGTFDDGGTTTTGSRSTILASRNARRRASRSASACFADPAVVRRSSRRRRSHATAPSMPAPMRSITFSHDIPNSSDHPTASSTSSSSVAPLKPSSARRPLPSASPNAPPGASGNVVASFHKRSDSSAALQTGAPARSRSRQAAADAPPSPRAGRCAGSRPRPARRRRSPTTTPTRRTGRAADPASHAPDRRRRDCRAARRCPKTTSRDRCWCNLRGSARDSRTNATTSNHHDSRTRRAKRGDSVPSAVWRVGVACSTLSIEKHWICRIDFMTAHYTGAGRAGSGRCAAVVAPG